MAIVNQLYWRGTILQYICLKSWPNTSTCLPIYLNKYGGRDAETYPTWEDIRNPAALKRGAGPTRVLLWCANPVYVFEFVVFKQHF